MKIGLLETGNPPGDLAETYGSYSAMFEALLGPEHSYRVYDVQKGELPADPAENDAYVITGSAAGVYDDDPWIAQLMDFLRAAKGRCLKQHPQRPLINEQRALCGPGLLPRAAHASHRPVGRAIRGGSTRKPVDEPDTPLGRGSARFAARPQRESAYLCVGDLAGVVASSA